MHATISRSTRAAVGIVASLALFAGCFSAGADSGDGGSGGAAATPGSAATGGTADLEQAAKAEGKLTLYGSAGESQMQAMSDAFMKAYPEIKVEYFRAAGTALFNRFSTEAQSGSVVADVFMPTVQPTFVSDNSQWFQQLTDTELPTLKDFPAKFRDDYTLKVAVEEVVAVYNTKAVPTPPTDWKGVLDPKFKGRIVLVDPKSSPGYMSWFQIMRKKFGDDYLKGLAALNPTWVDTGAVGAQQVAAGSKDISLPNYPSHAVALIAQGAPIKMIQDLDPTQGITTSVAITKKAPDPNAARLFVEWLASPDGYKTICADKVYSATIDGTSCQQLAKNFVDPEWEVPEADQNKIVSLLGR